MDFKNRHPLNAIDGYENLSMLEALIPFVEYQLKLPLALFIKFSEIRLIIKCFQSPNNLTRLGLHCAANDPWEMIGSLTGMSPELIKTMMSMMDGGGESDVSGFSVNNMSNIMNMMHNMQTPFTNSFEENTSSHNFNNHTSQNHSSNDNSLQSADEFDDNIQKLLAEYDLQQADSLHTKSYSNNSMYEDTDNIY